LEVPLHATIQDNYHKELPVGVLAELAYFRLGLTST
jgi:hypothetical protein